jgi:hypothetical protein
MRRYSGCILTCLPILGLAFVGAGCGQSNTTQYSADQPVAETEPEPPDPPDVVLSDAKMKFRDASKDVVLLELQYSFKKGKPRRSRFYRLVLTYPGTDNDGLLPVHGRQLKPEGGTLKDGWAVPSGVKTFEARLLEAPSPQGPWTKVSEIIGGEIQPP